MLRAEELVAHQTAGAARWDPEWVIQTLGPLVTPERMARFRAVLASRLSSVTVLFDSPYDPHNGAALVRSSEAFGVQHVHVVELRGCRFMAAPSVARGAYKWVDIHTYGGPEEALGRVRSEGRTLVAAHPDGELLPEALAGIDSLCIVVGNERNGIQEALVRAATHRVRVPMRGFVESLNVSVTSAILLHAATAQRPGDLSEAERARLLARALYLSVDRSEEILRASDACAERAP
jgi:tRNA (guanosine-2'-O-)-methyltransferase